MSAACFKHNIKSNFSTETLEIAGVKVEIALEDISVNLEIMMFSINMICSTVYYSPILSEKIRSHHQVVKKLKILIVKFVQNYLIFQGAFGSDYIF